MEVAVDALGMIPGAGEAKGQREKGVISGVIFLRRRRDGIQGMWGRGPFALETKGRNRGLGATGKGTASQV